jgi:hypothetical protein
MFRALRLRPGDVLLAGLRGEVPAGGKVALRPLSYPKELAESEPLDGVPIGDGKDFVKVGSPQAVLETELKHYSTLSSPSLISLVYNGKRYYFEVAETRDAKGRKVDGVKVQDCDVQVEFLKCKLVK